VGPVRLSLWNTRRVLIVIFESVLWLCQHEEYSFEIESGTQKKDKSHYIEKSLRVETLPHCESIQISTEMVWKGKIIHQQTFPIIGPGTSSHKLRLIMRPKEVGLLDEVRKATDPLLIRLKVYSTSEKVLWTGIIGPYRCVVRSKDVQTKIKKEIHPIPFVRCPLDQLLSIPSACLSREISEEPAMHKRLLDTTDQQDSTQGSSRKRRRIEQCGSQEFSDQTVREGLSSCFDIDSPLLISQTDSLGQFDVDLLDFIIFSES